MKTKVLEKCDCVAIIDEEELRNLIWDHLNSLDKARYPISSDQLSLYVSIPGGGDWSNKDLNIKDAEGLQVTWSEIKEEEY